MLEFLSIKITFGYRLVILYWWTKASHCHLIGNCNCKLIRSLGTFEFLTVIIRENIFRTAASNYLRETGERHGTVIIQISIGKFEKFVFLLLAVVGHINSIIWILFSFLHHCCLIRTGDGPGTGQAWGCDLSYDYVKINAEYTTWARLASRLYYGRIFNSANICLPEESGSCAL